MPPENSNSNYQDDVNAALECNQDLEAAPEADDQPNKGSYSVFPAMQKVCPSPSRFTKLSSSNFI